jgi:aspartate aminotransferase-like enzyme
MDLADPRVDSTIAACEVGLKHVLGSDKGDVFLYASNGHGVWEAVVENLLTIPMNLQASRAAAAVLFATAGFREVVGRVAVAHVVSARSP